MRIPSLALSVAAFAIGAPALADRAYVPDRPNATESPYTLAPGRYALEASLVEYTHDAGADSWAVLPFELRAPLTDRSEVQLVFDDYLDTPDAHGMGNLTLRAKWNFWGNDGDAGSALGILAFVKLPTAKHGLDNNHLEGGISLPVDFQLPGDWDVGAMAELDVVRNDTDDGYRAQSVESVTAGHALAGNLGMYGELTATTGHGAAVFGFDSGLTLAVGEDLVLDFGTEVGLSHAADDLVLFAGFARRF